MIEASQVTSTHVILFLLPSASVSNNKNEITLAVEYNTQARSQGGFGGSKEPPS